MPEPPRACNVRDGCAGPIGKFPGTKVRVEVPDVRLRQCWKRALQLDFGDETRGRTLRACNIRGGCQCAGPIGNFPGGHFQRDGLEALSNK
jgi:hypothetical protein